MKQTTRDRIIEHIKQFETNAVLGISDRTKRGLLRRFNRIPDIKTVYDEMLSNGDIHETGSGTHGSPICIAVGPAPSTSLPFPWSLASPADLAAFAIRLQEVYEAKGWSMSALDLKSEIGKALSEYQPQRPY